MDIIGSTDKPEERAKLPDGTPSKRHRQARTLRMEQFLEIKDLLCDGTPYGEISAKTGFSRSVIGRINSCYDYQAYRKYNEKERDRQRQNKLKEKEAKKPTPVPLMPESLVELRSLSDSMARIADSLDKIANQKRGLFR